MAVGFPSLPGTPTQFQAIINERQTGRTVELWSTEESIPSIPRILRWRVHEEPELFSEAVADRILVRPRAEVRLQQVVTALRAVGATVSMPDEVLDLGDWRLLRVDRPLPNFWQVFLDLRERLAWLARLEPDYILRVPPHDQSRLAERIDGQELASVGARPFWDSKIDNARNQVVVIDTGVDLTHPTLTNRLARNSNHELIGRNVLYGTRDPVDDHDESHGTYCAALVGGDAFDSFTGGVLKRGRIVPVKAFDKSGIAPDSKVAEAVRWASAPPANATIISASFANIGDAPLLYDEVKNLEQQCLFVTAAGNYEVDLDNEPQSPASFDLQNVLVVGGLTDDLNPPPEWSWGKTTVDLSAPGETIRSAQRADLHRNDPFQKPSGTSAATAIVAAGAALVQGAARHHLKRYLSPAKLKEVLIGTVTPLDKKFCDLSHSCGYLNLTAAIKAVKAMAGPDEPPS